MNFRRENARALNEAARREAAKLVRLAAYPSYPGESIKACITRVARTLGWTFARTEHIWRMEARRIDSWEMDQLRRLVPATAEPIDASQVPVPQRQVEP